MKGERNLNYLLTLLQRRNLTKSILDSSINSKLNKTQ